MPSAFGVTVNTIAPDVAPTGDQVPPIGVRILTNAGPLLAIPPIIGAPLCRIAGLDVSASVGLKRNGAIAILPPFET